MAKRKKSVGKGERPAARPHDDRVISVAGAREHNLREVSLRLPKNELICFTGVSGSGKSSLAFDTLYAEGQRRYVESLSSYARQFLGQLPKPNVDHITGLAPSISIQQKTSGWNPRSTVGTITQIHDYLRVLYARAGTAHCTNCGRPITAQTREQMLGRILTLEAGTRFLLLAPLIRGQKGEYKDLFAELIKDGYVRARVDGDVIELERAPDLDRYRRHDIEVVVDRLAIREGVRPRLADALDTALTVGKGNAIVSIVHDEQQRRGGARKRTSSRRKSGAAKGEDILLSSGYACTHCDLSFEPPTPQMFSFNSPQGMCTYCDGLGTRFDFDPKLLIPEPDKPLFAPAIAAWRTKPGRWRRHLYQGVADHFGFDIKKPWKKLPKKAREVLLYGAGDTHITYEWRGRRGSWKHGGTFDGILAELHNKHKQASSNIVRRFYEQFMRKQTCPKCGGARLNAQALAVTLSGKLPDPDGKVAKCELNLHEACQLPISRAAAFFTDLKLDGVRAQIAAEPLKEIRARLQFLIDVGLEYLTLDRAAPTLSGGESQRIRLASQIGCGLVGVLYVLDEPSIGLHPRDNRRLLEALQRLRDMGNTVIVVEHDQDTMEAADRIVDFGPGPGVRGGRVVAEGDLHAVASCAESVTGAYLAGRKKIEIPATRRPIENKPE